MFESEAVIKFLDKLRPWPWKWILVVNVSSFLIASGVSAFIGWWLMSQAGTKADTSNAAVNELVLQPSQGLGKLTVEKIIERNIFNSEGLTGDVDNTKTDGPKIAKTQLPIRVVGIIYGGNPFNGIAMVENSQSRNINSFMADDQLSPEAKLVEIHPDMIIIDNQGRKEFAQLEEVELRRSTRKGVQKKQSNAPETLSGSGLAVDPPAENFKEDGFERKGSNIELTAEYKNRLLTADFANVLQDAKASPNIEGNVIKGWRMDRIRKNSFYEKAGIQNGDIVEEINGVMLSDAGQSIKLLNQFRNESEIDLKIKRGDKTLNLNMKVR